MNRLTIRIESTLHAKASLPWAVITRRGRESAESQFFALLGYPETELLKLTPAEQESARDTLEFALRLLGSFEYIPKDPDLIEDFFEKKLLNLETKLLDSSPRGASLHAALGVTQDTKVRFAASGDILALQITPHSITNLAQSNSGSALNFESFQSGTLTSHSYLLFVPKQTGTLLKSDELKALTLRASPERKLDFLEHVWQRRSSREPFRAILLEAKPKLSKSTQTTAVSIARLLDTEAKTEELLSPPVIKPLIKGLQTIFQKARNGLRFVAETYKVKKNSIRNKEQAVPKTPALEKQKQARPRAQAHSAPHVSENPTRFLARSFSRMKHGFAARRERAISAVNSSVKHLFSKTNRALKTFGREIFIIRFNNLPPKSKILLLLTITFLFVFSESILLTQRHSRAVRAETAIQAEVSAIRVLIDTASASLIYENEENARLQIQEAKTRVDKLPEFQKNIAKESGLKTLRPLKFIADKTIINDLRGQLVIIEEKLRRVIIAAPQIITDENQINTLGLGKNPPTHTIFNDRLYTLETSQNQILRHDKDGTGFEQWLKDATDIRDGVSLAIDGFVYILRENGTVTKFLRGKKQDFELKPIDPTLNVKHENTTLSVERENTQCCQLKIWTNESSNYLYILDAGANRLAVFNKQNGLLKAQYQSASFANLQDFVIDEKTKTAYLLNNTNVVSIPLNHL